MKKLIALLLITISIACIFSGCGSDTSKESSSSTVEASSEENTSADEVTTTQTVSFPSLNESLKFVEKEFPEYKDSIIHLDNQVNLSKNGISFVVFHENNKFKKIWCKNTDFSSAFKSLSNYFSTFADIGITEEELESNMKISMQMPKYDSYTYEDNNFKYIITVGLDYVQIGMISKTGSLKISTEQKNNSSDSAQTNYDINSTVPATTSVKEKLEAFANKTGTYIYGTYEQDGNINNGKENIEWIPIAKAGNFIFMISKYCLDVQPYVENPYTSNFAWEDSKLANWLNYSFINTAFSEEEKTYIVTTGQHFQAKASILDKQQRDMLPVEAKNGIATEYAKSISAQYINSEPDSYWIMPTQMSLPGAVSEVPSWITSDGSEDLDYTGELSVEYRGVRPIIAVDISSVS